MIKTESKCEFSAISLDEKKTILLTILKHDFLKLFKHLA